MFEDDYITCDTCECTYPVDVGYCTHCDEVVPKDGLECEFCDKFATQYVQDNPVCDDHYEDAYPLD